jgi:hypothetical protein
MYQGLDAGSNVAITSDGHSRKHLLPSFVTDNGMAIETAEQFENAEPSITESFELDSNVTAERDRQSAKQ